MGTGDESEVSAVERYYDEDAAREWARLERHRMEYALTSRVLAEYLPPAPARILDIGGGPGRYALALAERGYDVMLLDLSQANLDFARTRADARNIALVGYVHGNALDLSALQSERFDAVLLLGPLYHLLTEAARQQALREAWQILRPGGLIFASVITRFARFAPFRDFAARAPLAVLEQWAAVEEVLRDGILRHVPGREFTDAYFAQPTEVEPMMAGAGFEMLSLVGCEGLVAGHEAAVNALMGEAWERWLDLNYQCCRDPSLYGAADHLLAVARRPEV